MTRDVAPDRLDEVLITARLDERTARAPDWQGESEALTALAEAMSSEGTAAPGSVLDALAEATMRLTRAQSAERAEAGTTQACGQRREPVAARRRPAARPPRRVAV